MSTNYLTYSRKKWRDLGYYVETVEHTHRRGNKVWRTDLHGFTDLLAVSPEGERVYLQVTSWANVPTRVRKIKTETIGKGQWEVEVAELARRVLKAGHRIVVEGWKQDRPGSKYRDREREMTLEDL